MKDLGESLPPDAMHRYFNAIDRNSDDKLDFAEFAAAMEEYINDRNLVRYSKRTSR